MAVPPDTSQIQQWLQADDEELLYAPDGVGAPEVDPSNVWEVIGASAVHPFLAPDGTQQMCTTTWPDTTCQCGYVQ